MNEMTSKKPWQDRVLLISLDNGYRFLLFSLVLILLAYPVISQYAAGRFILDVFVSLLLLSSLMAAVKTRRSLRIGLFLVVIIVISQWAETVTDAPALIFFSFVASTMFWIYVIVEILVDIFLHRKSVTSDMIFGALSVYLLIGIVFAFAFMIVETLAPGSFDGLTFSMTGDDPREVHRFMYFSFVTITTLGYGDLLPILPAARALAYMEAILGQIYLTVLVARLVAMYISKKE